MADSLHDASTAGGKLPRQRLHFLHIPKTGGTAISHALAPFLTSRADFEIVIHPHDITLADVPAGEKAFFTLRDPLDRFVSGFNSRRRQGRPRYDVAWNASEAEAFAAFATPNALAEALSGPDTAGRSQAAAAMRGIRLISLTYTDWLRDLDYVRARQADIVWVGLTSRLAADFPQLVRQLGLPPSCKLPDDPLLAHRRLPSDPTHLSRRASDNLRHWYATDFVFLEHFFGAGR